MSQSVQTDPQKIKALLEHDRDMRQKQRPKSYEEAARQILEHGRRIQRLPGKPPGKQNS